MDNNKIHLRHIMLFYFHKKKNATAAQKKICNVYGEAAVDIRTVQKWYARFRAGNFLLEDAPRSGRPLEVDEDKMMAIIRNDPKITTREIAESLSIAQSSVVGHLKMLGYVSRYDVWVPHELTEENLTSRISICDLLLKRNQEDPFLKRLVTGDEKWILYNNVIRKKSWGKRNEQPQTQSKAGLHPQKVMLCIWWDCRGVIYYELLEKNQTINTEKYCSQLDKLKAAIAEKRPALAQRKGVVFHHDNARPHTSLVTRQKLLEFGWTVLSHSPYSPDLAPSDYHLFRSLQNSLNGKKFTNTEGVKTHLESFFSTKSQKFFEDGIMKLPGRWEKVIKNNGAYIV